MSSVFATIVARDLRLAARRRVEALLPIAFFLVAVSLFPLGVGPEPQTLRQIAPGVVWVCALLATMLSLTQLYGADHADGSLEQMLLSGDSLWMIAAAKALAHWIVTGAPLVLAAPLFGLLFDLSATANLAGARCCWARHPEPARRPGRGADAGPAQRRGAAHPAHPAAVHPGAHLRRRRGVGGRAGISTRGRPARRAADRLGLLAPGPPARRCASPRVT